MGALGRMDWKVEDMVALPRWAKDWGVALLVAGVVFVFVGGLGHKPDLPEYAPDFAVETMEGELIELSSLTGRVVVLNFWASWCGPCKEEAPDFSRFAESNPNISVLGLAVDSGSKEQVQRSADAMGITFPTGIATRELKAAYDVQVLPTTVIIAPDGRVSRAHSGTLSFRALSAAVDEALSTD